MIGYDFKFGSQKYFKKSKRVLLDKYVGIGIRHRNNEVVVLSGETRISDIYGGSMWADRYRNIGWSWVFNLVVGVKIGIQTGEVI